MDIRGFFGGKPTTGSKGGSTTSSTAAASTTTSTGINSTSKTTSAKHAADDVFEIGSDDSDDGGKQRSRLRRAKDPAPNTTNSTSSTTVASGRMSSDGESSELTSPTSSSKTSSASPNISSNKKRRQEEDLTSSPPKRSSTSSTSTSATAATGDDIKSPVKSSVQLKKLTDAAAPISTGHKKEVIGGAAAFFGVDPPPATSTSTSTKKTALNTTAAAASAEDKYSSPIKAKSITSTSTTSSSKASHTATASDDAEEDDFVVMNSPSTTTTSSKPTSTTTATTSTSTSALPLDGLRFVLSGVMDLTGREELESLVLQKGGKVSGAVSGKTSYLVAGTRLEDGRDVSEGTKHRAAVEKQVKIITEAELLKMMRPLYPTTTTSASSTTATSTTKPASATSASTTSSAPAAVSNFMKGMPAAPRPTTTTTTTTSTSANSSYEDQLWVDKYKPKRAEDLIGSTEIVRALTQWLGRWDDMHIAKTYKPPFTKENPGAKMALLSGPPGIGKSTVATLVAEQLGFEVLELNASDTRNKGSVQEEIGAVVSSRSLSMTGKVKKRVIVMDEVDGMGGSDRGGIAELIKIAKVSKTPIICICNDRQNPKIRGLANNCYDLRVKRPTKQQIAARIIQVGAKEGLSIEPNAAELLVEQSGNDIRQVFNALQMWRAKSGTMSYMDIKGSTDRIEKDKILRSSPFDACGQILSGRDAFDDRFNAFFIDYSLVPLLVQQNYIDSSRNGIFKTPGLGDDQRMERLSAAADAVSDMDVIGSMIMGVDQHWELLPAQAAVCIGAGALVQGFQPFPAFPQWLGKYSSTNKSRRLVQELVTHTALEIAQGFTSMRLEYVPYLRTHMLQPLLKKGSDGAEEVVKIMDTYGLSKDDFMETMKDLQFVVEKDPNFSDQFANLDAKVKAALTRLYNATSHTSQALVDEQAGLKSSRGGGGRGGIMSAGGGGGEDGLVADDEDAVEALVGGDTNDDCADDGDNIDISAFIKKGRGSASAGAKRAAAASSSSSGDAKPAASKKAKK